MRPILFEGGFHLREAALATVNSYWHYSHGAK